MSEIKNYKFWAMPIRYVLLLAFALRFLLATIALLIAGSSKIFHSLDTGSYIDAAQTLASTGRFTYNGAPEIVRTPGYPLLLVPGAMLGNIELVGVALQIALSCLTVYLIYKIGLLLFAHAQVAALCALLYAIEPLSILYASRILTETLYTTLIVLFLYCMLVYFRDKSVLYLLASGLTLSASTFVRPISYYLPVVTGIILLVWVLVTMRRKFVQIMAVCIFFLLSVGPPALWQIRNIAQADYHGFSAIEDINWYYYQGASVQAALRGVPYYEVQNELGYSDRAIYVKNHPEQSEWSQGRVYEYMGSQGRQTVLQHLPVYASIHIKGILKTLLNPGGVEYLKILGLYPEAGGDFGVAVNAGLKETLVYLIKENPLLLAANLLFGLMLVVYLVCSAVTLLSKQARRLPVITVVVVGLYLLIMSGGPQSLSRFRHPIMPVLCILGGYGLFWVIDGVSSRRITRRNKVLTSTPPV